ncbi:bifunctional ADP-dependent NAD(P)H-hydrate dehydratase/NAD(P)H-hydrate epimerase [Photobacterium sanctipauli]|uniref:Bifunctional NAD(P)H-hydrate repair enzyme n=1 Tax=Photobacterium sanctipauli TaxID=1342794 RepID=A0A2T3NA46_9GAMM|nr:bifunctional ADP-dependent NAD(P)H-hydrate dehydratase/NAD(P)H-hydrate epimerase [Photobacterium sanctipauli]PSW10457.1 bifunctional ADP-dependent NAD(P)H-hydrate dehydratase/NAD(P)H-hydrate epimerase [Photobacterium sanctipauli]
MEQAQLPIQLYTAEQVRTGEQKAAAMLGLDMYRLMERAGAAVFEHLVQAYPASTTVLVCCGGGNNGGDGYVVARLALEAGYKVILWGLGDSANLTGDAAIARQAWLDAGGQITPPASELPPSAGVVVDALLGTGLNGPVRENAADLIRLLNRSSLPILSVDIPSGLCADTGQVLGAAIRAQATVTFIGCKQGLLTGKAANYVGELLFAGLDVESAFHSVCQPAVGRVTEDDVAQCLGIRDRTAHKGDHGRILCVGGDHGMGGAIRLAAEAAARSGAGLTAVLTQPDNVLSIVSAIPEIMAKGWQEKAHEVSQKLAWANVVVLGPGLGQSDWSKALFFYIAATDKNLVLDADGLNLLALSPDYKNNRIITPHPGEAARLLNCSVADVEADRFAAVRALQQKYGGVVVLKGAGSLIDNGTDCWLCAAGNPGMATGGMGDVLSGVIGALVAQGLSLTDAARVGVLIHSMAADRCAMDGERGMLASDLFPHIRQLVNPKLRT